ncbi:unnamed protein product [Rotaria magnacalcarata]|nr:unnamed protein product [Rotaria magnacalcarata]CAF4320430.1 unnamed protein product [Rotaria magnacalcarata]
MPKLPRRRSHSRNVQISLRRLHLLDKAVDHSNESSTESDDEEMKMNEDSFDMSKNYNDQVTLNDISDIFELCKNNSSYKFISVLLYMSLRHFKITWRDCDLFMKEIGALSSQTCQKWTDIFISGDFDQFCTDNRGGKHIDDFYEGFPDLELEAKLFAVERCRNKSADFTAWDLANFVDQKYYEITKITKDKNANFVRSIQSCRLDLRRWGFRFDSNTKRPYFEGHERPEIVTHRETLIKYFLEKKDHFYTISNDENPLWILPSKDSPSVLIFHDESTFRSGEVSPKRWLFNNNAPFFSKGRGRSVMISDYLVMHPSGPFLTLSDKEYQQALVLYPELADDVDDVTYVEKTATASIKVGYDSYFDNLTILAQFERLFKLLQFKSEFKHHNIEVIVDNATTHTAKPYSLSDFGKSIGTRCTTDTIEYVDSQGQLQTIDCFFKSGPNNGLSKGLLEISKELNVKLPPKVKLEQLREILANHPAFKVISRLE